MNCVVCEWFFSFNLCLFFSSLLIRRSRSFNNRFSRSSLVSTFRLSAYLSLLRSSFFCFFKSMTLSSFFCFRRNLLIRSFSNRTARSSGVSAARLRRWRSRRSARRFNRRASCGDTDCVAVAVAAPFTPVKHLGFRVQSLGVHCFIVPNWLELCKFCMRAHTGLIIDNVIHDGKMEACVCVKDTIAAAQITTPITHSHSHTHTTFDTTTTEQVSI